MALSAIALLAVGCQSTQDKSQELAKSADEAFSQEGLEVTAQSRDIEIVDTEVLADENGGAISVEMRNKTDKPLVRLPVSFDILGKGPEPLFQNNEAGLEPSLVEVPVAPPGETFTWVHDQAFILPEDKPRKVEVKVGDPRSEAPSEIPKLKTVGVKSEEDPVSGLTTVGKVQNDSDVEQRKVVVYAVGRRGRKVVAIGRSQIRRIPPGKDGSFQVLYIGDPKGAKIELFVPPPVLE